MESMRIIVTGVAGFIGGHVAQNLIETGHDVVGFDLVEPKSPLPEFIQGDFTAKDQISRALRNADGLCHLGGIGDIYLADKDPRLAINVNAYGTLAVCEACSAAGIKSMVYASTWEVYGKPSYEPIDEVHPCNPQSPYSISKLAGDLFARQSDSENGLRTTILRLGTAYGPSMRESAVIMRFVNQARSKKPLMVFGEGNQFRQFTHVSDIATAFRAALRERHESRVFNIVAEERTTVMDLARIISRRYGVAIEFGETRKGDPPSVAVSSSRAKAELGWQQRVPFAAGLDSLASSLEAAHSNVNGRKRRTTNDRSKS